MANKRVVWTDATLFHRLTVKDRCYSLPNRPITFNKKALEMKPFWLQLAVSFEHGVESARWLPGNPNSDCVVQMLKDIKQFGVDCLVVGDGATYNSSAKSKEEAIAVTGRTLAIVPPYSPSLSCPESVHRVIKGDFRQRRLHEIVNNRRTSEKKTAMIAVENLKPSAVKQICKYGLDIWEQGSYEEATRYA